jgi:hypothetical protein
VGHLSIDGPGLAWFQDEEAERGVFAHSLPAAGLEELRLFDGGGQALHGAGDLLAHVGQDLIFPVPKACARVLLVRSSHLAPFFQVAADELFHLSVEIESALRDEDRRFALCLDSPSSPAFKLALPRQKACRVSAESARAHLLFWGSV